jgi:hypothetical protein
MSIEPSEFRVPSRTKEWSSPPPSETDLSMLRDSTTRPMASVNSEKSLSCFKQTDVTETGGPPQSVDGTRLSACLAFLPAVPYYSAAFGHGPCLTLLPRYES